MKVHQVHVQSIVHRSISHDVPPVNLIERHNYSTYDVMAKSKLYTCRQADMQCTVHNVGLQAVHVIVYSLGDEKPGRWVVELIKVEQ